MNKKDLELIMALAEIGNITKASELIGYSQSGISGMLKAVETELGFPIFFRSKKGVRLTSTGEKLLPYVRAALNGHKDLEQVIFAINGRTGGHIKIAAYTSICLSFLPPLIGAFQKAYPLISFEICEGNMAQMISLVGEGQVDMGLCSYEEVTPPHWVPLREDDWVVIFSPEYKGIDQGKGYFPVEEFEKHPVIAYSESAEYDLHYILRKNGITLPKMASSLSSSSDITLIALVMQGLGISIVGKTLADSVSTRLRSLPLRPRMIRQLGIALPSPDTVAPAAQAFIDFAVGFCK